MKLELIRTHSLNEQTQGIMYVLDDDNRIEFTCYTLELPDKDNQRRISCIPLGTYKLKLHNSPKFGRCYWLQDVPNRSEILIHPANYVTQLLGCIAVGDNFIDLNKDNLEDVTNSRKTMDKLLSYKCNEIIIRINN